ncbi:MAG: ferredoxin [Verrucomicrobiales bacterium]
MSEESFNWRSEHNVEGKYYVDDQCLDCDLCRETAPGIFVRDEETGLTFVARQPATDAETALVAESMDGCPSEAIFDDGVDRDWSASRQTVPRSEGHHAVCQHCSRTPKRRWWQLWKRNAQVEE